MRDTMFKPPASLLPRIAPTEQCTPLGWPCDEPGRRRCCAASCTTRPRAAWAAWPATRGCSARRRTSAIFCRMLLNGGRSGARPHPLAADGRQDDEPDRRRRAGRCAASAGTWTPSYSSNRGELLPARLVRPHRVDGHVALDRSDDADVRHLPLEPRPSRRQGRRDAAARAHRDRRRRVGDCADRSTPSAAARLTGADVRLRRASRARAGSAANAEPVLNGIDVLDGGGVHAAQGQARWARHEPHGARA